MTDLNPYVNINYGYTSKSSPSNYISNKFVYRYTAYSSLIPNEQFINFFRRTTLYLASPKLWSLLVNIIEANCKFVQGKHDG